MDGDTILRLSREALMLTLLVSAIPVLAAMIVGLLVSLFQASTQLQEQTLTVVPKILAVFAALMLAGPWMVRQILAFSALLFRHIS